MNGMSSAAVLVLLANDLARVADTCRTIERRDLACRIARASRQLAKIAEAERSPQLIAPIWLKSAGADRHI